MAVLLWLIAALIVVVGIVKLVQGEVLAGSALLVLAALVGPGGYSLFA